MLNWNRHNTQGRANPWGVFPELSLVIACGLLMISAADTVARSGQKAAEPAFWISLVIIFIPTAIRIVSTSATRHERIALLLTLGLAIYLVKAFHSPLFFTFADELMHQRTLVNILATDHLFSPNPMLPISPEYPGLEAATVPFLIFSGLGNHAAGLIIIGVARLLITLSLFLFFEQVGKSDRIAAIASLVYMTNPHYVFFDAQFSYESLALPLSILTMYVAVRSLKLTNGAHRVLTITILAGIVAVATTHHITSQMLIAFLGLWAAIALFHKNGTSEEKITPSWTVVLAIVINVLWMTNIAKLTVGYLGPRLTETWSDMVGMLTRRSAPRRLFTDDVGNRPPPWEQYLGYFSAGLTMLGIPPSLLDVWKNHRSKALVLALAAGAVLYPMTQALRFTEHGLEIAGRFSPFIFVALAFVLALGSEWLLNARWGKFESYHWLRSMPVAMVLGIFFLGAVVVSFPRWGRLPGPYLVGADMRSVEPESINAAQWMLNYNGADNRIAADRTNTLLLNAIGRQRVVTAAYDNAFVPTAFLSPEVNNDILDELHRGNVRYLLIDFRMSQDLPLVGYYYDEAETRSFPRTGPVSLATLHKYDSQIHAQRIYDSGNIVIYDVSLIASNDIP